MTEFQDTVQGLACVVEALNQTAAGGNTEGGIGGLPWEDAIQALSDLRVAQVTIARIDAALVRHLYLVAPHGDVEVEGVGMVGIRRSTDRKEWDHDEWKHDVRSHLLEQRGLPSFLADPGTGEVVDVLDLLQAAQDVHGAQAPKVTKIRALGLEPQAYCSETPGKPSVTITRPSG